MLFSALPGLESDDIKQSFCLQKSYHFNLKIWWAQELLCAHPSAAGWGRGKLRALKYSTIIMIIIIAFLTRFHQLRIKNHLLTPAKKGFSEGESSANRDWFCECCLLCAALIFIDVKNVCSALLMESAFDQKRKKKRTKKEDTFW